MGGCCGNDLSIIGEDFIQKIIQDPLLKLNEFDYNLLLNSIESKRIQEQIYKNQIRDSLFPIFYEQNSRKSNSKYIKSIFSYLLTQFEETNNMNSVLLMFYPFINHKNENIGETLFNLFQSFYKKENIKNMINLKFNQLCQITFLNYIRNTNDLLINIQLGEDFFGLYF